MLAKLTSSRTTANEDESLPQRPERSTPAPTAGLSPGKTGWPQGRRSAGGRTAAGRPRGPQEAPGELLSSGTFRFGRSFARGLFPCPEGGLASRVQM